MIEVSQVVENFQTFRKKFNLNSVVGGLLLEIANNNNGTTISSTPADPGFLVTDTGGTIAAGAKYIKFTIPVGTYVTINGSPVPTTLETMEWGFNPAGYSAVPYTVSGGDVIITFSR